MVAIADVAHYVRVGTALTEAIERATSVYFPGRVIPMLPEKLSNDLCSLRPNVDRYAMVAEIHLTQNGTIESTHFFNAIIQSKARHTYEQIGELLKQRDLSKTHSHLSHLYQLYLLLLDRREDQGVWISIFLNRWWCLMKTSVLKPYV